MRALDALAALTRRSLEDPSQALTGDVLLSQLTDPSQLWSPNGNGRDPMRLGTAFRCVSILATTTAGCPIKVRNSETREIVHLEALSPQPGWTTPIEMVETVVAHLATRGNSYQRKVRRADGRIVRLMSIDPMRVRVEVDAGEDADAVGLPWVKKFVIDGGREVLTSYEILHIPGISLDGVTGVSPVEYFRRTFDIAHNAEALAERVYDRGLFMSGFLSAPGTVGKEQADILRSRWRGRFSGMDNAFDVGVLDQGATFQQVSMTPEDAQFLDVRKFQKSEIAALWGLPGWMINDQEKSTSWGTGMEQQFISFVTVTLKGYMQRIEQRYEAELADPKVEDVKFAVEGLLRGDSKSRAAFYTSAITGGWMTPNDVRRLEDLPPVPWGDEPYRPFNEPAGGSSSTSDPTTEEGTDGTDAPA